MLKETLERIYQESPAEASYQIDYWHNDYFVSQVGGNPLALLDEWWVLDELLIEPEEQQNLERFLKGLSNSVRFGDDDFGVELCRIPSREP